MVSKPLEARKSGASALLFYVMKGFSSKLHSRAEKVIWLLLHSEIIESGDKDSGGSNPVVEVLITVFQRLCEELQSSELKLLLQCEKEEIYKSISSGRSLHLTHLLSLFVSTMENDNVHKIIGKNKISLFSFWLISLSFPYGKHSVDHLRLLQNSNQCLS